MGGHLAGAIMLTIGLIALATGNLEFGAFLAALSLAWLLLVSFIVNLFRKRKTG